MALTTTTIALIILVITIICFVTEVLPLPVTAVGAALAMSVFGVIPYSTAFAGFANDVTLMVIGAIIIGEAMFETGLAQKIGITMIKMVGNNERVFIVVCVVVSAVLSAFLSNTAVVAMLLPVVAGVAASSGGMISKKNTYMAIGGGMTLVGSTPNVVGQGLLADAGLEVMGFFDLTWGSLPRLAFIILFYATFGYTLQKKIFTFPEVSSTQSLSKQEQDASRIAAKGPLRMWLSGIILIATIAGFVSGIWTVGTVAMVAGLLCIITGCIDIRTLFLRMDWTTVWVLAGALGFAAGVDQSGAGALIANTIIGWLGGDISMFTLMIVFTLLAAIMGNFMSSTAAIAILGPIAIYLCNSLGYDAKSLMMVIIWSLNLAFLTPIGTAPVTMTLQGGYRFMDYTKIGVFLLAGCLLISIVSYPFLFNL